MQQQFVWIKIDIHNGKATKKANNQRPKNLFFIECACISAIGIRYFTCSTTQKFCFFYSSDFFNIKGESLVVVLFSMPTWIRKVKFFCFLGFFFLADKRSKEKLMLIRFINCSYENEINVCYVYIHLGEEKT